MAAESSSGSRAERLKAAVAEARDESERLAALLALARHFAEVSDGVNGLAVSREARTLALQLGDWRAAAHALNSASVSQYHRSDYVSALATAIDAWDAARRARSPLEVAESFYTVGLALHSLGEADFAFQVVDRGLELIRRFGNLWEPRVRLVGLKAMLLFSQGLIAQTEKHCGEAVRLAEEHAPHLLELGHGNYGLALLRAAEQHLERGQPAADYLARARKHLERALALAEDGGDAMRVADRLSGLGQVALLEGRTREAEVLLSDAMRRSVALDYVRTTVISARYLARLHLARGDTWTAIEVLKLADVQARRGAPADSLQAIRMMLADALERQGDSAEAAMVRAAAGELREAGWTHRRRATADARRLANRLLEDDLPLA